MPQQIWTIARNTFTESIRQPVFVVVLVAGMLLLTLNPGLSAYTLSDNNKLLIDLGLSTIFLGGLFLAAFTATGVLSREIENRTVLTVISKPIGRPAFVLGKYLGVAGALGLAYWIWSIVFLLTLRHKVISAAGDQLDMPVILFGGGAVLLALALATWGNYFYGWVFTSRFSGTLAVTITVAYLLVLMINKQWEFQPITAEFVDPNVTNYGETEKSLTQILIAMLLVLEALGMICAVAIACSTRLGQVMTLLICLAMFLVGLSSDYMFGRFVEQQPAAWIGYALAPNLQYMWLADALTQQHPVNGSYVLMVTGYSALYTLAVLCLATALFQTRETG
jgi:ABC-type transport system involved in multi-copper enzyme maturation permease subunit